MLVVLVLFALSDSDGVIIVAVVASVVGPSIMALLTARMVRLAKKQDWERQDVVEERRERARDKTRAESQADWDRQEMAAGRKWPPPPEPTVPGGSSEETDPEA